MTREERCARCRPLPYGKRRGLGRSSSDSPLPAELRFFLRRYRFRSVNSDQNVGSFTFGRLFNLNALGRSAKVKATKIMGRAQEVLPTSPRPAGQRVSTAGEDAGVSRQRGATGDCQADEEIDGLKDEETEDPYKLDLPFPHQIGEIVLQAMVSVREGRVGAVRPLTPGQKSLSRLKQRLAAEGMAEIEAEAQTGEAELEVV
ncbi:hypothetical protein DFP72DRAFT_842960 [Ephemerocybe angulata]|uniref:Uncharacterized protein n=1 Tax=Ephemerocybe angulata TaxID=980116 RepID=A0A8H6IBZ5_9AGAR|nr:hypothetical protein DFP72DRAFT_842960 [Tulosesus angulatus]